MARISVVFWCELLEFCGLQSGLGYVATNNHGKRAKSRNEEDDQIGLIYLNNIIFNQI